LNKFGHIHVTADVSEPASVPDSTRVWQYAQIRESAQIGENCVIGRGAYIGTGVVMGDSCKIQNYALVYEPAILGDGVFIGPAAVLTNDQFPRATNPDLTLKSSHDWSPVGVTIKTGASIGANATCIAPVVVGEWALVGSGAVVTKDVPNFALVVGNPAKRIRWVGKAGVPLEPGEAPGMFVCPVSAELYQEISPNELVEAVQS